MIAIREPASIAAENRPLQICKVLPKVLPESILKPSPPPPPDGSSPTIAPTSEAAIPNFNEVKRYGVDFGALNLNKTCDLEADQVFI